eukprot:11204567-Lingulodinium_polyedra.AAC.1
MMAKRGYLHRQPQAALLRSGRFGTDPNSRVPDFRAGAVTVTTLANDCVQLFTPVSRQARSLPRSDQLCR